jgi:Homing endonuclease associated repeat
VAFSISGAKDMTRQEVIAAILVFTEKLGHVPSRKELTTEGGGVSRQQIRKHFGTYKRALQDCNLEKTGCGREVSIARLFQDWAEVVRAERKIPTIADYERLSKYSLRPLMRRFGSWLDVPQGLKQYAEEGGIGEEWKDVLALVDQPRRRDGSPATARSSSTPKIMDDRPMYGPPVNGCPLMFGPVNEAGVLFLFGAMAERLGFVVLRVQTEYPDCEAMRVVGDQRLQRVRIEVEYESKNFQRHMHDPAGCDLIVCWEHNWPGCPLEVLELKSLVGIQQNQQVVKRGGTV